MNVLHLLLHAHTTPYAPRNKHVLDLESKVLCNLINYHIVMFILCSTLAALLMSFSIIACHGHNTTPAQQAIIAFCGEKAVVFCVLSLGFDGALILIYLICCDSAR